VFWIFPIKEPFVRNHIPVFLLITLALSGCAAAAEPGHLTVSGIPERYVAGGIILVEGWSMTGEERFTYRAGVFQRISGAVQAIKLYNPGSGMVQEPFTASGKFTVTVTLHKYPATETDRAETRIFIVGFEEGGARIRWDEGIVPRS
jgi:hypothetical protein